jgi:hypothetical protein
MKVAFFEYFLNIRGTSKAIYDYAHYNETILRNESIIITQSLRLATHEDACPLVYEKFQKRFPVFFLESCNNDMFEEIQAIVDREKPDVLYVLWKSDFYHVFQRVKTLVHCVFDPRKPYGDSFCVISEWLNLAYDTNYPVIPHIVSLEKCESNLRDELGIPVDAVVFGRYGGVREFDHPAAHDAVKRLAVSHPQMYFLFMNTAVFLQPVPANVIFLEKSSDPAYKASFIDTCDAMLYARTRGETFGLSIAEFSVRNKPIFAPRDAPEQMHKHVLKENAYWYTDADDLCEKIVAFRPEVARQKDWNLYGAYSPEKVMATFQDHLTALVRPHKLCYVTTYLTPTPPKILDFFLNRDDVSGYLVVFVDHSLFHHLPRVLPSNVLVQEIDVMYLQDHSVMWGRLGREEEIVASPAFKALVEHRKSPLKALDTILKHAKVDFIKMAMAMVPNATHFAWIDQDHPVENKMADLAMTDKNVVSYDVINDINPAVDGQVLYTLQNAPGKVRGSFFHGSRVALLQYGELYHKMHQALHDHGVVIDDQAIALFCYLQKPDLFKLHLTPAEAP